MSLAINPSHLSSIPLISYEYACAKDAVQIADLHQSVRLALDITVRQYITAAIAERYFDKIWTGCVALHDPDAQEKVIKVCVANNMVAFARFGVINPPMNILPDLQAEKKWGELHQVFVRPEYHARGIGKQLFTVAAEHLALFGCDKMLVNVLKDNVSARGFYEHQGTICRREIIEHNTRNGTVYNVPCALYVLDIS